MRAWIPRLLLLAGVITAAAACATSQEWREWVEHPSHFATGQHLMFSVKNTEGSAARVTRADIDAARNEQWWGKLITVSPEQIIAQ